MQVDAAERAGLTEQVLRRANVHHRQGRAARRHAAGHAHAEGFQAAAQGQARRITRVFGQRQGAQRCGIQENRGRRKQREAVGGQVGEGARHQRRCRRRQQQRVRADRAQRHAGRAGGRIRQPCLQFQFQHRTGARHLALAGQQRVELLVEGALRGTQLQVWRAAHAAGSLGKFFQG